MQNYKSYLFRTNYVVMIGIFFVLKNVNCYFFVQISTGNQFEYFFVQGDKGRISITVKN